MTYRLCWLLVRWLTRLLLRRRDTGAEHVPPTGAVLLASNHLSLIDPPLVGTGIYRPCRFMAKEELFRNRFFGGFIRKLGAFPVRRGTGDRAALKSALEILAAGEALVMFPEGTRSETGELGRAELGVGMIALRSGAAVVPVYIHGSNRVLPRGGGFRLAPVSVHYGEPLRFSGADGKAGREEYQAAADRIMEEIRRLRDRYHPAEPGS